MRSRWNARLHTYSSPGKRRTLQRGPWQKALSLVWQARADIARADRIYVTGEDIAVWLGWYLRLSRNRRADVVTRFENPDVGSTRFRQAGAKWVFRSSLRRMNRILCRTQVQVDIVADLLGDPSDRISFFPEPVDTQFFTPSPRTDGPPLVLTAGAELRDYDTMRSAISDLDVKVVVATGSPWSLTKPSMEDSHHLSQVTVGSLSRAEMLDHYRAATIVVVPLLENRRSSGGSVVNEAIACRVPVIVSDTAGLATAFEDDVVVKVPVGDSAALRTAIDRLLGSAAEREQLTSRASPALSGRSLEQFVCAVESCWSAR